VNKADSENINNNSNLGKETMNLVVEKKICQFVITRHAHSCNNLKEQKVDKLSVFDRTSEHDPGITIYGMLATLLKTTRLNNLETSIEKDRYQSNKVYVSCLVRTWMTAIMLYLPNISENLELVISPFIKEKHITLSPTESNFVQIAKPFLKKNRLYTGAPVPVKSIDSNNGISTIDGGNLPKDIGEQIIMLIHFFNNLSIIFEYLFEYLKEINNESNTTNNKNTIIALFDSLNKMSSKKITLKIGNSNDSIILRVTTELKLDTDHLMGHQNTVILAKKIGKYYYFHTKSDPGFARNDEMLSIREVLQKYLSTGNRNLDKENIRNYIERILKLNRFYDIVQPAQNVTNGGSSQNEEANKNEEANVNEEANKNSSQMGTPEIVGSPSNNDISSTDDYLEKDISEFVRWVMSLKSVGSDKIHVVTHSDCMQSFCSRFRFVPVIANKTSKIQYGLLATVEGDVPLDLQLDKKIQEKNKDDNKENLNLKSQNSWDLTFDSDSKTTSNIKAFYGVFVPEQADIEQFISACERNCNYGYGVGDLVSSDRQKDCKDRLSGTSKFVTRLGNIPQGVKNVFKPIANIGRMLNPFGRTVKKQAQGGKKTVVKRNMNKRKTLKKKRQKKHS
jgi:hypothetical protein